VRRVVIVLIVAAGLARSASAEEIKDIVVQGNTKTTTDTVELIARIDVGDEWKAEMKDQVEKRLVSSGLFSDVEVYWETVPGGIRVHLRVKDKHSWVIAPAFYNQPTNTGGGIGYGENNLFGLNQKLLLYAQIATGDSFFVGAWVIPAIAGTRFYSQFDTFLKSARNIEYAAPTSYLEDPIAVRESRIRYLNGGFKLGVELFRGIKLDGRIRAANVAYSDLKLCSTDNTLPVATDSQCVHGRSATLNDLGAQGLLSDGTMAAPGKEGWDMSSEFQFTIDRRANWYGVSTGQRYQLSYEYSLGNDFHYHRWGLSLWKGWQVLERHNLVLKGNFNTGHHLPFEQELLTGGTSMRGWINNQFRGDLQALGNAEYSFPVFTLPFPQPFGDLSVRGLFFWDSAYTTFLSTSPDRTYLPSSQCNPANAGHCLGAGFKNSVGVGTRFYLRSIVIPLLGLDFGYGLEARDFQMYLAIGLTD
jgi:outer membrane protein assembly factor BamA